jgi:broad specificity phosphatase PhoE
MAAIYLIRHGQASWGKRDYDALSDQGIEQAKILGEALAQRIGTADAVFCGGMKRHRQTAQYALTTMLGKKIAEQSGGDNEHWREDCRWDEYDHQELIVRHKPLYKSHVVMLADLARTLRPREAFQEMFEHALNRWVAQGHDHEYKESWSDFTRRVNDGLADLAAASHTKKDDSDQALVRDESRAYNTLVFTSGGAISAVVKSLWNMPDTEWMRLNRVIANASITKVVVGKRGLSLSTFNEHAHFEGEQRSMLSYR